MEINSEDLKNEAFVKKKENVLFLVMNKKVNSFNPKFIRALTKCIDEIESNHGETALVTVGLN